MNILPKAFAFVLICSFSLTPFITEAWFFNAAQAQSEPALSDISNSPTNIQTMGLLSPRIAYANDLMPDDGSFVDILDNEALDPNMGASGTLADVIDDGGNTPTSVYIVQPGDTVALVASRFGISENTLRYANSMKKTDVLHRGDILLILPVSGIKYTVKSGDSVALIAKKYKLADEDLNDFLDYNNLDMSSTIHAGDALIIPGVELAVAVNTTSAPSKSSGTKKSPAVSTSNVTRGYFIKPIPCPLSQGKHDTYAVDISCHTIGTPIKAAASGTVVRVSAGWSGGYGNLVVIQHPNGMITFYAHMLTGSFKVAVGDHVTQGQIIGNVGSTGRSTGPHLHFEVRNGVNPGFDKTGSAWKQ